MSMTADAKFLMVSFEGEETLESALSVWTGNIIFLCVVFWPTPERGGPMNP